MNYEDMSDFEVNKLVAKCFGVEAPEEYRSNFLSVDVRDLSTPFKHGDSIARRELNPDGQVWGNNVALLFPCYCNSPSDAWPIIVDNCISINHGKTLVNDERVDIWFVGAGIPEAQDRTTDRSKVLRAAMICFLKMKDAEI